MPATRKNRKVRKNRVRKNKTRKVGKTLTTAITKVMNRRSETKYVAEQLLYPGPGTTIPSSYVNFNSVIKNNTDWYRCCPLLDLGEQSNQREGAMVTPMSIKVHLNLRFDPTSSDPNSRDIYAVVYCGKPKPVNAYNGVTPSGVWPSGFNNYLDNGDGGANTFFNGNQLDSIKKIGTDTFTLKAKRIIHLYKPAGTQNTTIGISSTTSAQQVYQANTTIVFNKPAPLRYESKAFQVPSNFGYCWSVGYFYADGTAPDTLGGLLKVSARLEMFFKDD